MLIFPNRESQQQGLMSARSLQRPTPKGSFQKPSVTVFNSNFVFKLFKKALFKS